MEALTNVAKYASATAVEVTIRQINGRIVIDVADGRRRPAGRATRGREPARRRHRRAGSDARAYGGPWPRRSCPVSPHEQLRFGTWLPDLKALREPAGR